MRHYVLDRGPQHYEQQIKKKNLTPLCEPALEFECVCFQLSNLVTSHTGVTSALCLFVSAPSQSPVHPISTQPVRGMGKSVMNMNLKAPIN